MCRSTPRFPPRRRRRIRELVLIELIALPAEQSRGRHHPRVVKRKMSNFPTKARAAPAPSAHLRYAQHIQIVAPAVPVLPPPVARPKLGAKPAPRRRPKAARDRCRQIFWLEHVKAWRASNLSRTAYCTHHHLERRHFDAWVARLRHRFRRLVQKGQTT
jgi:hypothetical protein